MGFLRRVLGGSKAPAWASFMTGDQYAAFERVLHADVRARGWRFEQRDDGLFVDRGGEEPAVYGLTNIAQLCAAIDRADWATAVREHFDHMVANEAESGDDRMAWERVAGLVKLRLYPSEVAEEYDMIAYPLAPGLVAVAAVDLPTTVATPQRGSTGDWPPVDEVWRVALGNLRGEPAPVTQTLGDAPSGLALALDDSFFTASRLLLLPDGFAMDGTDDALVAVPTRHSILVHPIRDLGAVQALNAMTMVATRMHEDGPGSIVPTVYWWHRGALTQIPALARRCEAPPRGSG